MALEQTGVQLVALGGDVYISTMQKSTTATNTFVSATESGGGKVSSAGQVMIGALRQVGTIAVNAFAEAGKATLSFVKDSIGVAGDFQAGMNKFQSVAGSAVDTKGLEKFKDLFISLGKELPVSTSEVEQAAIEMVSGGIDPAIVQAGALRSTIQFAAASGLSLADAAATSAKFLAGWTSSAATTQEKVDFLTTSTDALTKAAAASSTTAAELRLGIFNVQGAAQALHAPFTDVVATLAELAPAFESSAQAGTALNVFMTRLEPQTKSATGAMMSLGLITKTGQNIFFDAKGGFLGMANAAQVLKEHMSGLSDEEKINTLHTLFGNDAMKVGNLLMQDGAAGIQSMQDKMAAANGVSATAALMQTGYNTALENAKGSVEALQITIGSALLPVLTDLMNNVIAPGVNVVTDFASALSGNNDAFLRLSPAVQDVVTSIDTLVMDVQNITGAFSDAGTDSVEFAQTIGDLAGDFGLSADAVTGFVFAIQDLVDWVGNLSDVFASGGISGLITQLTDDISAALPEIESQLAAWGQAFVDWIAPYIPPLLSALGDLVAAAGAWVVAQAPTWGRQLVSWGQQFVAWIAPMIPPAIAELGKLALAFGSWIADQAAPLVTKFLAWKDAFIAWIPGATVTFLAEWPKMFDQFLTWIGNQAGPLLKQLGEWAVSFIAWIIPMIPGFIVKLGLITLAIGVFVVETAGVLLKKIQEQWVPAIVEWVLKDALPKLLLALLDMAKGMANWANQMERDLGQKMRDVGQSIVDGIKKGLTDAWSSLTGWLTDKVHSLVDHALAAIGAGSPAKDYMPVGQFMVQGIMIGFTNAWPELQARVATYGKQLADQAQRIAEQAQQALADGFTATATIDRQIAANLEKIAQIKDAFTRALATQDLQSLQAKAQALYPDPKVAAQYFKMLSDNYFETLDLRQKIAAAGTQAEKDALSQQLVLISNAQRAEEQAFQASQTGQTTQQDLIGQLNAIIATLNEGTITDATIAFSQQLTQMIDLLRTAGHLAGGGSAQAGQPYWVGEQGPELFFPTMNGTVMPAASSAQLMRGGGTVNNSQSTSYHMPVYTNQSPSVLQQSFAVMRAGLI